MVVTTTAAAAVLLLLCSQPLLPVEDASFLILQKEAAAGERMDLARVMLTALDDTRRLQVRGSQDVGGPRTQWLLHTYVAAHAEVCIGTESALLGVQRMCVTEWAYAVWGLWLIEGADTAVVPQVLHSFSGYPHPALDSA